VCPFQVLILLLSVLTLGTHIVQIVLPNSIQMTHFTIVKLAAEALLELYIGCLSLVYVSQRSLKLYSTITIHMCSLAGALWLHLFFSTYGQYISGSTVISIQPIQHCLIALVTGIIAITACVPLGPLMKQDISNIYTKEVATKVSSTNANMGFELDKSGASILSLLCFSFAFKTISKAATVDQIDIQDLPVVEAHLRGEPVLLGNMLAFDHAVGLEKAEPLRLLCSLWRPHLLWSIAGKSYFYS
jgi:hypothetical protein